MLPYAIEYGMSVKEFWEEAPELFWAYRFSYIRRKESEEELINTNMWLQGMYIYEAVSVALSNAFSKNKITYRDSPYSLKSSNNEPKQNNKLEMSLRNRVMQVQKVFGGDENNAK